MAGIESPCSSFQMPTGAVSRYKLTTETEIYHLTEVLLRTDACPGTATSRKLSRKQERFAKTVTSLFTLTVLAVRASLSCHGCRMFNHNFFSSNHGWTEIRVAYTSNIELVVSFMMS